MSSTTQSMNHGFSTGKKPSISLHLYLFLATGLYLLHSSDSNAPEPARKTASSENVRYSSELFVEFSESRLVVSPSVFSVAKTY